MGSTSRIFILQHAPSFLEDIIYSGFDIAKPDLDY